jgi:hypothetical protein
VGMGMSFVGRGEWERKHGMRMIEQGMRMWEHEMTVYPLTALISSRDLIGNMIQINMDLEINSSFISPKLPNTLNYNLWVYKYVIHLVYRMNISRCVIVTPQT